IRLWDVASAREQASFNGHAVWVHSVTFSPNGKRVASGGGDQVKVWEMATCQEKATFKGHTNNIAAVVYSPDGKTLASAAYTEIKLRDVATGKELRAFKDVGGVESVVFSPDGKTLASGSGVFDGNTGRLPSGQIKLWDVATGKGRTVLKGHTNTVNSVSFS